MSTQSKTLGFISTSLLLIILTLNFSHFHTEYGGAIAQISQKPLQLVQGAEKVQIMKGDWIVAVSDIGSVVIARGRYMGMDLSDSLRGPQIHFAAKDTLQTVPVSRIKTLWRGRARETGRRAGQGAIFGAAVGAGIGYMIGSDSYFGEPASFMLLCAAIDGAALAVVGGGVGLLMHLVADDYELGQGNWEIVLPDDPPKPVSIQPANP